MSNTILFAQINPSLKVPVSTNEFQENVEFIQADWMFVTAQDFPMGSELVQFTVVFGKMIYKEAVIVKFDAVKSQNLTLSGPVIESWGTDDSEILYAVAASLGTNIVQIEEVVVENNILFFN